MNERRIAELSIPLETPQVKERKAKVQAEGNGNGKLKAPHKHPLIAESYSSPAERRAEGKRLRDAVPRTEHKSWKDLNKLTMQMNRPQLLSADKKLQEAQNNTICQ